MTDFPTSILPGGFEALQPYAATWGALETPEDRYLFRQQCTMEELKDYYDIAAPRLDAVFDHLEKFPMNDLPAPEALLYRTVLGLTEAAMAIEVFGQPRVPYAPYPHKIAIDWAEPR
jgi:hypothetical protein